jgi:hypothetical protein
VISRGPDNAMTVAAADRLVHHATVLEMNVDGNVDDYRRRAAMSAREHRSEPKPPCSTPDRAAHDS